MNCESGKIGKLLDDALHEVFLAVGTNETDPCWPYLVWTGMFENRVRDAVACRLLCNTNRTAGGGYVCREFGLQKGKRVDLAVANMSGDPIALVEFKQMYTYDHYGEQRKRSSTAGKIAGSQPAGTKSLQQLKSFYSRVISDACKLRTVHTQPKASPVELYVVLIAAHFDFMWNPSGAWHQSDWYLKYAAEVRKIYSVVRAGAGQILNDWHQDVELWPVINHPAEKAIFHWFGSPQMCRVDRWKDATSAANTLQSIGVHGVPISVTWRIWQVA